MYRKLLMRFALMTIVILCALPLHASAQSDADLIDVVAKAFDATLDLNSMQIEGTMKIVQQIGAQGITIDTEMTQKVAGQTSLGKEAEDDAYHLTLDQTLSMRASGNTVRGAMTMEIIQTDGVIYLHFSKTTGAFAGQFPTGWINLTENPNSFPGAQTLNLDQVTQMTRPIKYTLDKTTVMAVSEQANENIRGQEMRVIKLTLNSKAFGDYASQIAGMFNAGALGVDPEAVIEQMFRGATLDMQVWVGQEDSLIHRAHTELKMDAELTLMGQSVDFKQTVNSEFNYDKFNEPVSIEAPKSSK